MIKQLIILAQLIGLFIYQLFFSADVSVTQKLPASIAQQSETIIELTVNKGDITGFAKIQQDFPKGFTIEPLNTKGATFSFVDNKVKIIWVALPDEEEFIISYKIIPNKTVKGKVTLGGRFSFITENERETVEISTVSFSVVKELPKEILSANQTPKEAENKPIVEEIKQPIKKVLISKLISCERTIERTTEGKYKITFELNKEGIEGFSKITEEIPDGFTATEGESVGGVFSFKRNFMKILWIDTPKETTYKASYFMEAKPETKNGSYIINGSYSFLEDETINKSVLKSSSFILKREALIVEAPAVVVPPKKGVAAKSKKEDTMPEVGKNLELKERVSPSISKNIETKKTTPSTTTQSGKAKVAQAKKVVLAEATTKRLKEQLVKKEVVAGIPSPEKNITYKVQVAAGHKKVSPTYFASVYQLEDRVSTFNHKGWIKYLVGSYNTYKLARDKRNVVRENVEKAFVTAYNAGTRITVQEALMISSQKWYK